MTLTNQLLTGSRVVAVIPARGGSKRLPRKNIVPILGRPLIGWAIEAVLASSFVSPGEVYVSTEDAEIASVARSFGAGVIARPPELARDEVWTDQVIQQAVLTLEAESKPVDIVLWMNACAPEIQAADIDRAIQKLLQENLREVFAVDARLNSTSVVRAVRRETLFQNRLSVRCGVLVLDYVDIHYPDDVQRAERRLLARNTTQEQSL
jgi:CMP-N-acetylneuraminic acid synthetase